MNNVFQNNRDCDRYVYHYTTAAIARNYILREGTLKLGSYTLTNDPREVKNWQVGGCQSGGLEDTDLSALSEQVTSQLKEKAAIACFCQDVGLTGEPINDANNRGYSKPRMWSQYADAHRGVCLVFERMALDEAIRSSCHDAHFVESGAVAYIDRRPTNRLDGPFIFDLRGITPQATAWYFAQHAKKRVRDLFFEKGTDWSTEAEYRWLAFLPDNVPRYVKYKESLAGLMLGADCEPADTDQLTELAQARSVPVSRLLWINGAPWPDLNFGP